MRNIWNEYWPYARILGDVGETYEKILLNDK